MADYAAVREGLCPLCLTPLVRCDQDHGRCDDHGCWAAKGDQIIVCLHVRTDAFDAAMRGVTTGGPT